MKVCSLILMMVLEVFVCFSATVMAQNIVPNADFDSGSTGWTGGALFQTDGLPSAPSYLVVSPANSEQLAYSDCFALPLDHTKSYTFSGEMRTTSNHLGIMTLYLYQDSTCTTGLATFGTGAVFGSGNWELATAGLPFFLPGNAMSGKIQLIANDGSGSEADVFFDHFILEPEEIFTDAFESL